MSTEKKREWRANWSNYQRKKYNESKKKYYDNLTPEKKAKILEKRKAHYEANKERLREYQRERYHKMKNKENECQ
jgi:hypothetical protein